jgi:hypothetical protein
LCEYEVEGLERLNMPTTIITVDADIKSRLADLAREAGQEVDEFTDALLRRVADADVRFEAWRACTSSTAACPGTQDRGR